MGKAPEVGTRGAHQTGGLCREGTSQLIFVSPGWQRAWSEVDTINSGGGSRQMM